jgi:hypothetical protein
MAACARPLGGARIQWIKSSWTPHALSPRPLLSSLRKQRDGNRSGVVAKRPAARQFEAVPTRRAAQARE